MHYYILEDFLDTLLASKIESTIHDADGRLVSKSVWEIVESKSEQFFDKGFHVLQPGNSVHSYINGETLHELKTDDFIYDNE